MGKFYVQNIKNPDYFQKNVEIIRRMCYFIIKWIIVFNYAHHFHSVKFNLI